MKQKLFVAGLLIFAIVISSTTAYATSPEGYIDFPVVTPVISGLKTGSFGPYDLPGKGATTINYTDVRGVSRPTQLDGGSIPLTPAWLALGYNSSDSIVPAMYQEVEAGVPGVVEYEFERSIKAFDIAIIDVDSNDVATIEATDQYGNAITDFTGWTVLGTGDMSTNNPPGGPDPAPAPIWTPTTGTISSGSIGQNSHRSYIVLRPDVAVQSVSVSLTAPVTGHHIYTTIYSQSTPELSIGNYIWNDENNDGVFQSSESVITDVDVELLSETGAVIDTDTTDENGLYLFADLPEARYQVRVAASNFESGGALVNYRSSLYGNEPALSNNQDDNETDSGSEVSGSNFYVLSAFYDLFYDSEPDNDGDALRSTNLTLDFGFVLAATDEDPAPGVISPNDDELLAETGTSLPLAVASAVATVVVSGYGYVYHRRA